MMQAELSCKLKIADNGCSECVDAALAAFLSGPAFWHFFFNLEKIRDGKHFSMASLWLLSSSVTARGET